MREIAYAMKITSIETSIVDAGFRPWTFVKVETDEGVTGYGECSDGRAPLGIAGTIEDLVPVLVGQDPRGSGHEILSRGP